MTIADSSNYGIVIGIDASNLREGGGVTHLSEILRDYELDELLIHRVIVWGSKNTLDLLLDRPWLNKILTPEIDKGLFSRICWQKYSLPKLLSATECNILFVPGGSHSGFFQPVVTLSQNLLPFEWGEMFRYGLSWMTLRLLLLRWVQSQSFRSSDGLIFLTNYAKQRVLQSLGKIDAKTIIIPHGLNSRFLNKPKVQKPICEYSEARPYKLLYVSPIDQYKHQWHVIEAVFSLRQEGLPLRIDFVGPSYPPAFSRLKESIAKMPSSEDWIFCLGEIPYEELHHIYAQADLGIFASSCENLPNILIEKMAMGLPIACSNRGPMPEILGEAGEYFDPEQPIDISRALRVLINSAKLRNKKANSSYHLAKSYSWDSCAKDTFAFLSEVAKCYKNGE